MLELCLDTMFPVDDEPFPTDAATAVDSSQRSTSTCTSSLPLVPE